MYNSLATVGRVSSMVWFWLSFLIAIVLLAAGGYHLFFAKERNVTTGLLCIAGASLVVAVAWVDRALTRRYKPYAAVSGGVTIIDAIFGIFD